MVVGNSRYTNCRLVMEKEKIGLDKLIATIINQAIMESKAGWAGNVKRQRHIGDFTHWKQHDA